MEWTYLFTALVAAAIALKYYSRQDERVILTENASEEYDYVIVGGGTAGSVLASRLAEDETNDVLLLDAGCFYDEAAASHVPADWPAMVKSDFTWDYYSTYTLNYQMPNPLISSGTSVINAMQYTRGSPFDYDEWAAIGCTGWSYEDVLPYFLKSEDIQIPHLKDSEYHHSGGPIGVHCVSSGAATELASVFLDAGEMGYNITDYNSKYIAGFNELQISTRNGVRENTGLAYLGRKGNINILHVILNSYVTKLNIENESVRGVHFIKDNRKHYVRTRKEVIVSAGVINSPQLLMLSGIGPREHLEGMGIPVIADLPVGEHLQDHQVLILSNKITKPLSINSEWMNSVWTEIQYTLFGTGVKSVIGNQATAFVHTENSKLDSTYPDLMFIFGAYLFQSDAASFLLNFENNISNHLFSSDPTAYGFGTGIIKTHPESTGTIRLKSKDPFVYPVIDPQYLKEISDVKTFIEGIRIWERILQTKATTYCKQLGARIEDTQGHVCSEHEFRSDDYWECYVRHVALTIYHHSGTCKMGDYSDATAVVDPELRVCGIKGLRIVDASVFPKVTSGNTVGAVIMVAEKAADLIRGKNTVSHLKR